MKLQSKNQIDIKGRVFGGEKYLYCISLRPDCLEMLRQVTQEALTYNPDFIEWRVDHFGKILNANYESPDQSVFDDATDALRVMASIAEGIPLLLCLRQFEEGGVANYPLKFRYEVIEACIKTGLVSLIDIEDQGEEWFNEKVTRLSREHGVIIMRSNHTYTGIVDEEQLITLCKNNVIHGGDISKVLVMAKDVEDVIKVARAMRRVKEENIIDQPFCFYAMGEAGIITRINGDEYGADFVYFSLRETIEGSLGEGIEDYLGLRDIFKKTEQKGLSKDNKKCM